MPVMRSCNIPIRANLFDQGQASNASSLVDEFDVGIVAIVPCRATIRAGRLRCGVLLARGGNASVRVREGE